MAITITTTYTQTSVERAVKPPNLRVTEITACPRSIVGVVTQFAVVNYFGNPVLVYS